MTFSSIIRTLGRSPLATELLNKLKRHRYLQLNGLARLPKGLVASALAQQEGRSLLVVTATLEEAGRWVAGLEAMGWQTVHFYPTSEASPYELSYSDESEMTWGQMQVLADLVEKRETNANSKPMAIVSTERALQSHLPPPAAFEPYCLTLKRGMVQDSKILDRQLASMGYDRVALVEMEGQWSRRGDIVDVFPVAAELPVRLEWFGDDLEQLREFDPATQRSLDKINQLVLTPTDFGPIVAAALTASQTEQVKSYLSPEEQESLSTGTPPEGSRRFLGMAFDQPASLLDYLPENTLIAIDEPEQCRAHSDRAYEHAEEQLSAITPVLPKIHRSFDDSLATAERLSALYLSELADDKALNLASRPVPVTPHQFAKLAEVIRGERDRNFSI